MKSILLNPRAIASRNSPEYNSPERVHERHVDRISKAKRYRENSIENLKTKKKHL